MKVIIVGAGLGGLSAAYCFARTGHDVHVYERASQVNSRGGGLSIRPSASRIIESWGLRPHLEQICDRSPSVTYRNLTTGNVRRTIVDDAQNADWGTTRRALIKLLHRQASAAGAHIHFNATVTDVFDDASTAGVVLENGPRVSGDIVLAADGIKSRIRETILSDVQPLQKWEPIVDTTTFYTFDMALSDLTSDASTMRLTNTSDITTWMGDGGFVVTRCSSKFKRIGLLFAIQAQTDQKGLWDDKGDIEDVRNFFSTSCAELTKACRVVNTCDRWRVAEVPNLPRWSSKAGRIVLLGDSAHAMHPNAAQGLSTIIEDVGVLEYLLSHFGAAAATSVPDIVQTWQAICKPRAERVKDFARWNTDHLAGHARRGWDAADDGTSVYIAEKGVVADKDAHYSTPSFWKWNVEYDAIREVCIHELCEPACNGMLTGTVRRKRLLHPRWLPRFRLSSICLDKCS
jgi:salicylate hydroxylase